MSMANLLSKPWVVCCAGHRRCGPSFYLRVVAPLLTETDEAPVIAEEYDDIDEVIDSTEDPGIETVETGSAVRDGPNTTCNVSRSTHCTGTRRRAAIRLHRKL